MLGVLLIAEVLIVLAMNVGVVKSGGAQGLNLEGFMPSNLFTGAAGVTVLFAFASYVGFEATTIYGEEAKERKKTVPRATYIAVIFIGLFYSVTFWAIGVGYGNSNVTQAATDNQAGLVFDLTRHVVGPAASDIMNWLVMTSVFATVLSFHNTLSRYMFAMGRDGALPQRLGRAHGKHRSPHSGSMVQTAIAAVVVIAFAVAHADPYLQLYAWFIGFGTVGILVLYAAGALSVVWFFRRHPGQANAWVRIISPLLALVGLVFATYLSIANFSVLTGSTSTFINLLWLVIPIAAVIGYFAPPAHAGAVPDVHAPTPILDAE